MEKYRSNRESRKRRCGSSKAEICAAWDTGESAVSIARRFQVSVTTVYRYNQEKPLRNRKITTGEIKAIRELRSEGFTGSEIAEWVGISKNTVYRFIKGIPKGGNTG